MGIYTMKSNLQRKLVNKYGMTISELLIATIIILLVSAGMVTSIQQSAKYFNRSKIESESKTLCSSLEVLIENELRYTERIKKEGGVYSYQSQSHAQKASLATISVATDTANEYDGNLYGIVVLSYSDGTEIKLLSEGMYTLGIQANVNIDSYDESTGIFKVNLFIVDKNGDELIKDTFYVENLSHTEISTT